MVPLLANTLLVGTFLAAVWSAVEGLRGVRPSRGMLATVALLWLGLTAQAGIGTYLQFTAHPRPDPVLFLGYQLSAFVVLPLGTLWAIGDRSRWGNGVLAVACITETILVVRMVQIWVGRG